MRAEGVLSDGTSDRQLTSEDGANPVPGSWARARVRQGSTFLGAKCTQCPRLQYAKVIFSCSILKIYAKQNMINKVPVLNKSLHPSPNPAFLGSGDDHSRGLTVACKQPGPHGLSGVTCFHLGALVHSSDRVQDLGGHLGECARGAHLPRLRLHPTWLRKALWVRTGFKPPRRPGHQGRMPVFPRLGHRVHLQRCPVCPAPGPSLRGHLLVESRRRGRPGNPHEHRACDSPSQEGPVGMGFGDRQTALFQRAWLWDAAFTQRASLVLCGVCFTVAWNSVLGCGTDVSLYPSCFFLEDSEERAGLRARSCLRQALGTQSSAGQPPPWASPGMSVLSPSSVLLWDTAPLPCSRPGAHHGLGSSLLGTEGPRGDRVCLSLRQN